MEHIKHWEAGSDFMRLQIPNTSQYRPQNSSRKMGPSINAVFNKKQQNPRPSASVHLKWSFAADNCGKALSVHRLESSSLLESYCCSFFKSKSLCYQY